MRNLIGTKYHVTKDGQVLHIKSNRYLMGSLDKDGYRKVCLTESRKRQYTVFVHRLVAIAHIPNPDNLTCINHKDGDKQNNCVANLEWCTPKHNTQHAWATGLAKPYDRSLPYNRQGIIDSNKRRYADYETL